MNVNMISHTITRRNLKHHCMSSNRNRMQTTVDIRSEIDMYHFILVSLGWKGHRKVAIKSMHKHVERQIIIRKENELTIPAESDRTLSDLIRSFGVAEK